NIMSFFAGLKIPVKQKDGQLRHLPGLISIEDDPRAPGAKSIGHRGATDVYWRFNSRLENYITGANNTPPMFMLSNHKALFSYGRKALHLAPALQLYIESHMRNNLFKGLFSHHNGTFLTPQGDGITLGKIAERLGMHETRPYRYEQRIMSALDAVGEAGVISDWKIQGPRRDAWGDTKVAITVSDTYQAAYELTQMKRNRAKLDRQLEKPFAPEKRKAPTRSA
ncbi:MAG: hypothetical protein ACPGVX_10835, partial [Thalassobaculaceae bacterium]